MKKLSIFTLLSIAICLPGISQSSKDKKEGLKRIGGGATDDDIAIIVNGAVVDALVGLEGLEGLSGLSSLSSLSQLSALSELGDLGNFDFDHDFDFDFDFDFENDFDLDIDIDVDPDFDFDFDFDDEEIVIDFHDLDRDTRERLEKIIDRAKNGARKNRREK